MATIPLKRLGSRFAQLERRIPSLLTRAIKMIKPQAVAVVQDETNKAIPTDPLGLNLGGAVATGAYRKNWRAQEATLNAQRGVLVFNTVKYAPNVEQGRGAGKRMPPRDAIAKWAMVKFGVTPSHAKRIAFPIARAIGRRGLRARKVLTGATTTTRFEAICANSLQQALEYTLSKWEATL